MSQESHLPSSERWALIEPLLDGALGLPADQRAAWLASQCDTDQVLFAEVSQMLANCTDASQTANDFDGSAAERFASLWDDRSEEQRFAAAIADQYVIEREIGRGGMAIVYRARSVKTGLIAAVKVLRLTASASGAPRFRREIELVSRLQHSHIVPLLASGECDGRLWYAMPFIDGESLQARLRREPRLSTMQSLQLLRDVAQALAFAHAEGVVHRDLKPGNILLAAECAMIADFGVAKALLLAAHGDSYALSGDHIRTATGVSVGTLGYMSPEQAAGEKFVDHRADLYSLGVIAYELLAGTRPFVGDTRQSLLTAQLTKRPLHLSAHGHVVSGELEKLVMQLIERFMTDRPATTADVANAFALAAASAVRNAQDCAVPEPGTVLNADQVVAPPRRWWQGWRNN